MDRKYFPAFHYEPSIYFQGKSDKNKKNYSSDFSCDLLCFLVYEVRTNKRPLASKKTFRPATGFKIFFYQVLKRPSVVSDHSTCEQRVGTHFRQFTSSP